MPSSYYIKLRNDFSANFEKTEKAIEKTEQMRGKFPVSVARELYCGVICHINADKKLSKEDEDGAIIEMEKAVYHSCWALFDVLKLHLLSYLRDTREARVSYRGHEDLAYKYIPNYTAHSQTLFSTRGLVGGKRLFSEKPEWVATEYYRDKIINFLIDFEALKPVLFAAINKEKEAKVRAQENTRFTKINIVVSILGLIGASVLSSIFSK